MDSEEAPTRKVKTIVESKCSCFNVLRVILVSIAFIFCFGLGLILNLLALPVAIVLLICCMPCYFCINWIKERQEVERRSEERLQGYLARESIT